jgi:hypothetical protein
MYACNCREWLRSWPKLQNTFTIAWVQDARYEGAAFKNCPWCGEKLRIGMPYSDQVEIEAEETVELPPVPPKSFII